MSALRFIRRSAAGVVLALATLFVIAPAVASAASETPPPPAADAGTTADSWAFSLNASTVLWITAVLIPVIGGVLMRAGVSSKVAAGVNVVLNAVNALVVTATTDGGDAVFSQPLITNFLMSTVISIASLYGFWKPIGVDDKLKATPGLIGPKAS